MWKVVPPIVLCTSLLGCTVRDMLPMLTVRAMTVLHDRAETNTLDAPAHRADFALSVQLALQPGARPRKHSQREVALEDRDAHFSAEPLSCADAELCAWADTAEQSVLAAMGVLP
jgi:hypothetical protein